MSCYYGVDVSHAAVANFDGIFIKNVCKFVAFREVSLYQLKKYFANICFHIR